MRSWTRAWCIQRFHRRYVASANETVSSLLPSLMAKVFPHCRSCGIQLQNTKPSEPGYYILPGTFTKPVLNRPEDAVYEKYMNNLSQEDKELLGFLSDIKPVEEVPKAKTTSTPATSSIKDKVECLRCRKANFNSDFNLKEHPIESVTRVLSTIPVNGTLVYVINCVDFPLGVNEEVFKYRPHNKVRIIINKADLLFQSKELANRYGQTFFSNYFKRKHGIDNLLVVSGKKGWNIKQLGEFLDFNSYFIGNVNSGKSTILNALLYLNEEKKVAKELQLYNKREKLQIQKEDGAGYYRQIREKRKQAELFKLKNGSGTSHMPGFTRGFIEYEFDSKPVYDVPGFSNVSGTGIYEHMIPTDLKRLSKGVDIFKSGTYDARYYSMKSNQVLTVGGLFFVKIPNDTVIRFKNCINFPHHVFRDMSKAMQVYKRPSPELENYFTVSGLKLKKLYVPPFFGEIDLVLKDFGHITLTPTGRKSSNHLITVYIPECISEQDICIREPLVSYTRKTLAGRDKNGSPLKKEKWSERSIAELKTYSPEKPFSLKLITPLPRPADEDEFAAVTVETGIDYSPNSEVSWGNRFQYWLE
ncbi:Mitochondrial ribosome small subunit biogenesis protein [Scheffersomyces spartinae]|uniref:Genetic interactor of prohibitins 3, mitochondrial n=1 Tax=Scheffersomyces spartinae TaxID=45513 RepID=A0A9P7VEC4_9ASCO|nr:Mitochondrial ribosome small subunit biogenesis protein [Scheffersomyces spartinae]KAG7196252.1 Mitochondrial ribosome small subunit biogenesis protein [Scheffersomyces spartinae]